MQPKFRLFGLFSGSLVVILCGLILASPLICVSCKGHTAPALAPEGEDAADGESQELELETSEFSVASGAFDLFTPRAYEYRVVDDLVGTEAALADSHLQRGPPDC
jgi:hypothetical protein